MAGLQRFGTCAPVHLRTCDDKDGSCRGPAIEAGFASGSSSAVIDCMTRSKWQTDPWMAVKATAEADPGTVSLVAGGGLSTRSSEPKALAFSPGVVLRVRSLGNSGGRCTIHATQRNQLLLLCDIPCLCATKINPKARATLRALVPAHPTYTYCTEEAD